MSGGLLLVEDDADIRENLALLLEDEGYPVEQAAHGEEALERLSRLGDGLPCLVLLDLMMPVMDGWTLREKLLADPTLARVPVIILSGVSDLSRERRRLQAAGAIAKPIDVDRLLKLVERHC